MLDAPHRATKGRLQVNCTPCNLLRVPLRVKQEKEGNFMVVKCDIVLCTYNKGGFCKRKAVVHINGNGVCNVLTKPNWREGDKK